MDVVWHTGGKGIEFFNEYYSFSDGDDVEKDSLDEGIDPWFLVGDTLDCRGDGVLGLFNGGDMVDQENREGLFVWDG